MIQTRDIGERNYQAGTRVFEHPQLGGFRSVLVSFTRVNWPNPEMPDLLTVIVEIAPDGTTWQERSRVTFAGGSPIDADTGLPFPAAVVKTSWALPKAGLARITAINRATLRTAVHLEIADTVD